LTVCNLTGNISYKEGVNRFLFVLYLYEKNIFKMGIFLANYGKKIKDHSRFFSEVVFFYERYDPDPVF